MRHGSQSGSPYMHESWPTPFSLQHWHQRCWSKPAIIWPRTHFFWGEVIITLLSNLRKYYAWLKRKKSTLGWMNREKYKKSIRRLKTCCDDYAKKRKMADFLRLCMREMTTGDVTLVLKCTGRVFLTFSVAFRAKKGKAISPLSESYLCNKN